MCSRPTWARFAFAAGCCREAPRRRGRPGDAGTSHLFRRDRRLYRIKQAGWEIRHLPLITITHHADKAGINPKMEAQSAYSRLQYAQKHFSPGHRVAYAGAVLLRYLLRSTARGVNGEASAARRAASRRALRVLTGREEPPFGQPPSHAVAPRAAGTSAVEVDSADTPVAH
jgi:hypothetical protein